MINYFKKIDNFFEKNYKVVISLIIVLQVLIMFSMFLFFGCKDAVDSQSYYLPAIDFIKNGTMRDSTGPTLIRTPGYILFLALIYLLTNYSNNAVILIQSLMCFTMTYLIYYLVSNISKKKSLACFSSFFYICDIAVYTNALSILTDTLFPFLLILSLLFLYKYINNKKYLYIFLSFLCLNYALAVRPQILYLNIILNFVLLVLFIIKKIDFKVFLTFLLMFITIFGGWSYRNYKQFGKFDYVPLRSRDYFLYYAPYTYQQVNGCSFEEANSYFEQILSSQCPEFNDLTTMEQIDVMSKIGKEYVADHFKEFIICNFKGLFIEMVGPNTDTIEMFNLPKFIKTIIKYFAAGMLLLSYCIYALCFLKSIRRQKWLDWTILLIVMYLMASTAIVGYSRYRLAFYSLCLIGTFTSYKRKY